MDVKAGVARTMSGAGRRKERDRQTGVLKSLGYGASEVDSILAMVDGLDTSRTSHGSRPDESVLQRLLLMQDIDPAVASIMARTVRRIDWRKLTVASQSTGQMLDLSTVSLLRHRQAGNFDAMIEHRTGQRSEAVVYSLAEVLYVLAWRRNNPYQGGPYVWMPEALRR